MGRPKIEIDFEKINKLCEFHCTAQEIVAHLKIFDSKISYNTVERRIKEEFNMTFGEYVQEKHNGFAKPKIRGLQWKAAENGNTSMLIWLGKQYLGQTDKQEIQHSGEMEVKSELIEKYLKQ